MLHRKTKVSRIYAQGEKECCVVTSRRRRKLWTSTSWIYLTSTHFYYIFLYLITVLRSNNEFTVNMYMSGRMIAFTSKYFRY